MGSAKVKGDFSQTGKDAVGGNKKHDTLQRQQPHRQPARPRRANTHSDLSDHWTLGTTGSARHCATGPKLRITAREQNVLTASGGPNMTKVKRTILAIVLVEVILGGIWFYLVALGARQPERVTADYQATLGSTMGMAMGAFLGFGVLLLFIAAKRDRQG